MGEGCEVRICVPARPEQAYEVWIAPGVLERLPAVCRSAAPAHRYAVIADSHVAELYGKRVVGLLAKARLEAELFTFPAGEWNKTGEQWAALSAALLAAGFGRDTAVVALGGGVTGDLAGFVAATYMRGVPVVQVPTTVLAMVDSSVGGKTGIDLGEAKNAVGAFHHPRAVLVDPELLHTLPPHQRAAGLAEAVKAAAIRDDSFFEWIEANAEALAVADEERTTRLIERAVRIKAAVVEEDPEESGLREILNFGHTIAHALETISGYAILHGEAVAEGMRVEAWMGEELGWTQPGTAKRLDAVLRACDLPDVLDRAHTADRLLEAAAPDKKARQGELRWVRLERIGVVQATEAGWAHPLPAFRCADPLSVALRKALEAADSAV